MMKKIKNHSLVTAFFAAFITSVGFSAMAEMPETDVDFINQMSGPDAEKINALELYYNLHVSELEVQMITEQNTGAFLGGRRAEREGNASEAKRLLKMYEDTKSAKIKKDDENRQIREKLSEVSKIEFPSSLVMAPEPPERMPTIAANAPEDLKAAASKAWQDAEVAKKSWKIARMNLLEGQEKYNNKIKGVRIGDLMRSVTAAEIELARTAGELRLIVARIAIASGKPLGQTLLGL
ncbi:MAG: hypothetical protein KAR80_06395 [Rhodospirillaceae bacterium]|nr:hypothetical protein [Rhodospirillaceae bacterium]